MNDYKQLIIARKDLNMSPGKPFFFGFASRRTTPDSDIFMPPPFSMPGCIHLKAWIRASQLLRCAAQIQ